MVREVCIGVYEYEAVTWYLDRQVEMLFDGFGDADRRVSVCGLECENRLQALQRIFEHEMVHLIEQLCWEHSNWGAIFPEYRRAIFLTTSPHA